MIRHQWLGTMADLSRVNCCGWFMFHLMTFIESSKLIQSLGNNRWVSDALNPSMIFVWGSKCYTWNITTVHTQPNLIMNLHSSLYPSHSPASHTHACNHICIHAHICIFILPLTSVSLAVSPLLPNSLNNHQRRRWQQQNKTKNRLQHPMPVGGLDQLRVGRIKEKGEMF